MSADLWGMLGPCVRSQLPRQLDVSHSTTAATLRAPQVQKPMVAGRKDTQSTLPSPPPHMQLPSLRGRLESTLRGEAKALPLLGHGCQMWWARMARNGANSSWPLLGDNDSSSFWFKEENGMNTTPVAFPSTSLFHTWHSADLPVMTDLAGSDTDTHRHMSLGFLHMPQPWLTFYHYKMTETTWQAQSKQVMMHMFIGIIVFLN